MSHKYDHAAIQERLGLSAIPPLSSSKLARPRALDPNARLRRCQRTLAGELT